jgi:hypothetical protein
METTRSSWIATLERLSRPLLEALAKGELRRRMPVEERPGAGRAACTHLEAAGRLLCGIAPWLELDGGDERERRVREELRQLAVRGIAQGVLSDGPDRFAFEAGQQPIVDTAFLAQALLRAPHQLRDALAEPVRRELAAALASTRDRKPSFSNWLLFAAITEAALSALGQSWDRMRVDFALRQHEQWYKGDGIYGDGPQFHWDYYNAFVIQPMLVDVHAAVAGLDGVWDRQGEEVRRRAARWAAVQERLIAPDGSFPVIGRSIAYRCGAFQSLAQAALLGLLPPELPPAQARCALDAVIRRTLAAPGTFDGDGWLRIGLCGHQPSLGEGYISTGSLYLCATAFLPLGLPPEHPFWSGPDLPWTGRRAWSGEDLAADHAI